LFNYITFTETATTKVEKQFIQQQEKEHVQIHEQQEQVQIQAQTEQIVQKKTKTKKHKKHIQEQEQRVSESTTTKYEQRETLARETTTGSPQAETLEQIEQLLPTYETLTMQNLPTDTLESVAVAVTTELSTPKPISAQVQDEVLPQKVLAIREECLPFDQVGLQKAMPRQEESKLSEKVEVRKKHAVNVDETKTDESSKELVPSKIPKSVRAQYKVKELRPLLVEAPSVEETIENLQPLKTVTQQAHGDILLSHELTEEQQPTLESIEKLKPIQASEETVQQGLLNQQELIITEVISTETVGRGATQTKPVGENITPQITPNISLGISECQPEDSLAELKPDAKARQESSKTSVIEHKAVSGSATAVFESVEQMPLETQPTRSLADYTINAEEVPVQVQEIEPLESLEGAEVTKKRTVETKALELFELAEGLVNITADSQSPINEALPSFKADVKEAIMDMQVQHHVITLETVSNEQTSKDLGLKDTPNVAEGTWGQSSALTIGETQETNIVETADELIEPIVQSTKPAKGTLTKAYGTAESKEEALFDSLGLVPDEDHKTAHGKVVFSECEIAAEVQTSTVIDKEEELIFAIPEMVDAKLDFVEQTALEINQDTTVDKEEILSCDKGPTSQLAAEKMITAELKVSSIFQVQPGVTSSDIIAEETKSVSANEVFEAMLIGVTSKPDFLESTSHLQDLQQPELKTGSLILDENQQPLEVTNVQVTEMSTELIDVLPNQKSSKAQAVTEALKYTEGLEVVPMESTTDKTEEIKPTAVLAEISMSRQFGTNVGEQAPLESIQQREEDVKPQTQTTEGHFGLLQPLETSSCVTFEGETILSAEEPHSLQSAAIETSPALQVANTMRPQHMESLKGLDEQREPKHQAHVNIGEITLPNVEENIPLDVISEYNVPEYNKSSVGSVKLFENMTALKTTTAIVNEHTSDLKDQNISQQVQVKPKLGESTQKIPISERANVFDQVSDLIEVLPTTETIQSSINSLFEINVRETEVFEKEDLLEGVAQPSEQLIKIALDSTTGIALVRQEDTLEQEQDLKVPSMRSERARPVSSELLQLPVTEHMEESQSTGDLEDFSASNKFASPKIDLINETKSSETTVYDSVTKSVNSALPESIVPKKSLVPHVHTMVTGSIVFDAAESFEDLSVDQRIATKIQDNLSHSIISEDQSILESETFLGLEKAPSKNAKLLEELKNLHARLVDEATTYDAMGQSHEVDKYSVQQAEVTHEFAQVHATDIQLAVEAEKELRSQEQSYSVATTDRIPSRLVLAMTTKTQPVEGIDDLLSLSPNESIAETIYEGRQHEVIISEVRAIEESKELLEARLPSVSAMESIDTMFKATPESHQPRVFQKESTILSAFPQEAKAKSTVDLLQGTSIVDSVALETSAYIKDTHVTVQEAQQEFVAITESNKVQVYFDNIIMQKEDILENRQGEYFGKPFIEGPQLEMLVTEVVTVENVGDIDLPVEPVTFLGCLTTNDRINQSHIVETQIPLEIESEAEVVSDKIAHAQVKSDEVSVPTTVSVVNFYEKTEDFQDLKEQGLFVKISKDADINKTHLTTIQSTFVKEDTLPQLKVFDDTAQLSNVEFQSLVTEEVVSISSIQETFELKIPSEGKANVAQQIPHEAANVCEQIAYEQSPDFVVKPGEKCRTKTSTVQTVKKPAESLIVNVYENIEGHGDFRPNTSKLSPDTATISELKVSVVEEVTATTSLGSLTTDAPKELKAMSETVLHKNIVYCEELPCEAVSPLLEDKMSQFKHATTQPCDVRVAPLTTELGEKGTVQEIIKFQADKEHALPSIERESTYLNQQTITHEQVHLLEEMPQKTRENAMQNIFSKTSTRLSPDTEDILKTTLIEGSLKNALQATQFVSESLLEIPQLMTKNAHFETSTHEEAHSTTTESQTPLHVPKDDTDSTQKKMTKEFNKLERLDKTVKKYLGKYIVRCKIRSSTIKAYYFHFTLTLQTQSTYYTKQSNATKPIQYHILNAHFFTQIQNKAQTPHTQNKRHQHKHQNPGRVKSQKRQKLCKLFIQCLKMEHRKRKRFELV